jgi:hypothetical protein
MGGQENAKRNAQIANLSRGCKSLKGQLLMLYILRVAGENARMDELMYADKPEGFRKLLRRARERFSPVSPQYGHL